MVAYEKLLMEEKSSLCIDVGEVTSTMACTMMVWTRVTCLM